jgi:hypothetical protein
LTFSKSAKSLYHFARKPSVIHRRFWQHSG